MTDCQNAMVHHHRLFGEMRRCESKVQQATRACRRFFPPACGVRNSKYSARKWRGYLRRHSYWAGRWQRAANCMYADTGVDLRTTMDDGFV